MPYFFLKWKLFRARNTSLKEKITTNKMPKEHTNHPLSQTVAPRNTLQSKEKNILHGLPRDRTLASASTQNKEELDETWYHILMIVLLHLPIVLLVAICALLLNAYLKSLRLSLALRWILKIQRFQPAFAYFSVWLTEFFLTLSYFFTPNL